MSLSRYLGIKDAAVAIATDITARLVVEDFERDAQISRQEVALAEVLAIAFGGKPSSMDSTQTYLEEMERRWG